MSDSSTPEGTGTSGGETTVEDLMSLLPDDDGQSGADEALKGETPEADPEDDEAEASEDEGEEQSDDEEAEDADDEQPPATVKVKIDGEEQEVTLEEAIKGYQRSADYTRKTQELAETRKAVEAESQALAAERERTTQLLTALEQSLQQPKTSPEDLAWLRTNNPAEYAARIADESQRLTQLQAIAAEKARQTQALEADQARAHAEAVKAERQRLVAERPDWWAPDGKLTERGKAADARIGDYMAALGVTPEERAGITDHRLLIAIDEAAQYRALKAKAPQTKAKVEQVKVAKPGTANSQPSKMTERVRAEQRLKSSGNPEDAVAYFMHLIPD